MSLKYLTPQIPAAPRSMQKGVPLSDLLGEQALQHLARNIYLVHKDFAVSSFVAACKNGLEGLALKERAAFIAEQLREFLPSCYSDAIKILLRSLTPPLTRTDELGLQVFFYLPHVSFIEKYGLDRAGNAGVDPFEISMQANYEITKRFSAEFCIRPFLIHEQERTLQMFKKWVLDLDPHVRRLCSEGARSRLPWTGRIPAFIKDPSPVIFVLEALKNDPDLYVRRSVANHVGDIAKDHPEVAFSLCEKWLAQNASKELKWVIRHAVRHPAQKGVERALQIRIAAK